MLLAAPATAESLEYRNIENAAAAAACGLVSVHDAWLAMAYDGVVLNQRGLASEFVKKEINKAAEAGYADAVRDGFCAQPGLAEAVHIQIQGP
jgi:hypothetical protein